MYALNSDLGKREYLAKLKQTFRSPFLLFSERVSGIILGPFFSVAYHSPYEWNRKITSECNRAWGYVKEIDGKAYVRFIRGKGLLAPSWFVFYTLFCYAIFLLNGCHEPVFLAVSCGLALVVCLATAFESLITEQGEAGFHEISRLLLNPEEYYG